MFPGSNSNAGLGYNKHNQYMAQPHHFLAGPNPGTVPVPAVVGNPLRSAAPPVMPLNMQGCIDWAQLAQQWIHMRDTTPAPPIANFSMNMPIAPPPPIISHEPEYQHNLVAIPQLQQQQQQSKFLTHYEEHGEAEMDMDMDEEENENESNGRAMPDMRQAPPPPIPTPAQWLENTANEAPSITVAPNDAAGSSSQPWNNWGSRANPTAHIPSLLKLNVCNPNEQQHLMQQMQQPQQHSNNNNNGGNPVASTEIDANKRKMLPAWIREGLEKMEREKQRQLERQQSATTPEIESINVKQVSSKTLTTPVNLLNISNVASDSEDSIAAPEEAIHAIGNDVLSKTFASDDDEQPHNELEDKPQQDAVDRKLATVAGTENAEDALSGKNYEERLADLMLVVRRTLTEILLETTNEEIAAIATETIKAHRAKASSAQVIRKSALSSITGNLGLAAYGDSSSESEEEDETNDDQNDSQLAVESDKSTELTADELKARIRKSKRAFEKVIDDIEERVSLQEQLDEQKLQQQRMLELEQTKAASEQRRSNSRAASPADDIATTTATTAIAAAAATTLLASSYEKSQQFNGKRLSRKERTTRFSDNKDGKQSQSYVSQVAAVAAAAVAAVQSSAMPAKLKPVPNPATNLLQMPEHMASMLSAADKALDKAQKSSKKSKRRRRQSSSSSSSSSSGNSSSSSSSSDSNSSSNTSKSTTNTDGSSTRSSHAGKKHSSNSSSRHRSSSSRKQQRSETSRDRQRKGHSSSSSSRHSYNRREHDRERDRHALHYSSSQQRGRRRDSSHSADENGRRSSRHSSSYGKQQRDRTRSRSKSRSTHNSYSSASTTIRKRH